MLYDTPGENFLVKQEPHLSNGTLYLFHKSRFFHLEMVVSRDETVKYCTPCALSPLESLFYPFFGRAYYAICPTFRKCGIMFFFNFSHTSHRTTVSSVAVEFRCVQME